MTEATTTQAGVVDQDIIDANAEPTEHETAQDSSGHDSGDHKETDRERIMREISERRMATLNETEAEFTKDAGKQQGIEDRFEPEPDEPKMVTIKVDGVERQVPLSDVLEQGKRAMQKESSADQRLAEVAQQRQKVEQRAAEIEAFARQLQAHQEQNQGQKPSEEDAKSRKLAAKDLYENIMSGDEDAAVDALANMFGRGNAIPDMGAIMDQAARVARGEIQTAESARNQIEANANHAKAKTAFSAKFPDIINDPMLYRMTDQETLQVLSDHPDWDATRDIDRILMEAGDRVQKWRGANAQSSKTEIKRGLKPVRSADGRMPGTPAVKQLTTSEVIAAQRRTRGLPVY